MSNKRPLTPAFPLCRFSFADGRRCAQPASPDSNGLCYTHAHAAPRRLRPSDLTRELTTAGGSPPSAAQIRRLHAKLPRALAEGLLTQKEVRCFTYLCNVLLQCARASQKSAASRSASAKRVRSTTPNAVHTNGSNHLTVHPVNLQQLIADSAPRSANSRISHTCKPVI